MELFSPLGALCGSHLKVQWVIRKRLEEGEGCHQTAHGSHCEWSEMQLPIISWNTVEHYRLSIEIFSLLMGASVATDIAIATQKPQMSIFF